MGGSKDDSSMSRILQDLPNFVMKDADVNVTKSRATGKAETCKYLYNGGCRRGINCPFAYGEDGLGLEKPEPEEKQGDLCLSQGSKLKCANKPRDMNGLHRRIFVGGLPPYIDSDDLKEFFDYMFGPVEDAEVIVNQEGSLSHSRGFGFITFECQDSAAAAIDAHYTIILGKKVEIKSAVRKPIPLPDHNAPLHTAKVSLVTATGADLPPWVSVFQRWLPRYLVEATKRLGVGEWYPLSQLKSDFRATCGLELDHASLGYLKLNDFMACFPDLCSMKMVPTGKGPATHMVLLPFPPTGGGHNSSALQEDLEPPEKPTPPTEVERGILDFPPQRAWSPFIPFSIWSFGLSTAANDESRERSLFDRQFDYYENLRTGRPAQHSDE